MSQEAVLDPMDQEILGEANSPEFTNGDNAQTDTVQRINAYSAGNGTLVHEDTSEDALQDTADKSMSGATSRKSNASRNKREAGESEAESPFPKKKRTPAKKTQGVGASPATPKAKRGPKAKGKNDLDENGVGAKTNSSKTSNAKDENNEIPTTPSKRAYKSKPKDDEKVPMNGKAKTKDAEIKDEEDATADDFDTSPMKPKQNGKTKASKNNDAKNTKDSTSPTTPKRQPTNKVAKSVDIPTCLANASEADKKMVRMKEAGESWHTIRAMWKKETGQDTATSTLPNRYNRLKVNMMQLKDGDDVYLRSAKQEIEVNFERTKWAQIATAMETKGADKYPTAFLEKKWKEIVRADTTSATANGKEEETNSGSNGVANSSDAELTDEIVKSD